MSRAGRRGRGQVAPLVERAEGVVNKWGRSISSWRHTFQTTQATCVMPVLGDLALTLGVTALSLGPLLGHLGRSSVGPHATPALWLVLVLTLLETLPLIVRRRWPLQVLVVIELAVVLHLVAWPPVGFPTGFGLAVALYTVASRSERRFSMWIAGLVGGINGLILFANIALGRSNSILILFTMLALVVGSWALGDNVSTRIAYLAQIEERARLLALEQEERAQRAVHDERTRIARELHDVVAHHVSAIAVQAGAGAEVAERYPARAREVLQFIQETSRQALTEMRAMLNLLRSDDEATTDLAPQPSLAQVERLVNQSRAVGLPVTLMVEGTVRVLPDALDLSAYRIVQEALTNTLKHAGPADATVLIRYTPDTLDLEISDNGRGPSGVINGASNGAAGAGRGLVGMRERVALFGGELIAKPLPAPGHGFLVYAQLPFRKA